MRLLTTRRFERDLKRAKKRGRDLERLWIVVERILVGRPLEPRHRLHRLSGKWSGSWECHIAPDWLLIRTRDEKTVVLVRTGTHADLFE